ncbi:MAG TPA: hypothetical protein EYN91_25290 [Candidatus Melainabacteria bacterium]|nr:hypothetical protein [Candidatus Melainabacteria bacterium]HIN67125.1 hypothetical protein [Candidatus Obscuribacterales bacterium]
MKHLRTRATLTLRSNAGLQLIELLAALFIAGLLSVVLSSSLSEVIRLTTATDRTVLASTVAQEVIDRIRATPYDELPADGTYDVQVNLGGSSDTSVSSSGGFIVQRPAMLDGTKLVWTASSAGGELPQNRFRGSVSVAFASLPVTDVRKIVVSVSWSDSTRTGVRQYEAATVVGRNGIMRHE